ncbi:MAG: hypothetical protein KDH93_28015, partial [Rhodoferax sp.]|nr:hypothetical protein [Rhodoferax sp.]
RKGDSRNSFDRIVIHSRASKTRCKPLVKIQSARLVNFESAPTRSALGAVKRKIWARQWPRPVLKPNSRGITPPPSLALRRRR